MFCFLPFICPSAPYFCHPESMGKSWLSLSQPASQASELEVMAPIDLSAWLPPGSLMDSFPPTWMTSTGFWERDLSLASNFKLVFSCSFRLSLSALILVVLFLFFPSNQWTTILFSQTLAVSVPKVFQNLYHVVSCSNHKVHCCTMLVLRLEGFRESSERLD